MSRGACFCNTHNVLQYTGEGQDETRSDTDEEDGGDVERECDTGVREENEDANLVEVTEGGKTLDEGHDDRVDDGANGGEVVQRDKRVHLHAVEQDLDHDETRRLEDNGGALADEADELEVNLSIGSEGAAEGDHENDREETRVGLLELEGERDQENADGVERLEHLDEGHGEREVGVVRKNQRSREESTDRQNRPQPTVALKLAKACTRPAHGHLNVLRAVDKSRRALKDARGDSGEGQVPCREEDRVGEVEVGEDVF